MKIYTAMGAHLHDMRTGHIPRDTDWGKPISWLGPILFLLFYLVPLLFVFFL